jgi:hypothetical protein
MLFTDHWLQTGLAAINDQPLQKRRVHIRFGQYRIQSGRAAFSHEYLDFASDMSIEGRNGLGSKKQTPSGGYDCT